MNTYRVIDMDAWPRREMFEFYQGFVDPCFNIAIGIEGQRIYDCAHDRKESFFLLALYAILRAANVVPQMRLRIVDGKVVEFDRIAAMTPIMTMHEQFCQCWCEYEPTFDEFARKAKPLVETAAMGMPNPMTRQSEDFICASCIPWMHFTSISAASYHWGQTTPILSWGKLKGGIVPFASKFSHSFLDGLHVSRFFEEIENSFAQPERLWSPVPVAT